ncbi:TlpA family protein disulfide reductase [Methylomonas sp. LL1]|uniref:TlpA family protein disulfide reductase n=1 Tax=Methylomonas sp. LL1 TaxID=2785785 RepID=UPI0018C3D224|nr:TlpA disulfide reductase family protein [Methylomonas sp. LL1]QPK61944.1 TlpA family protein disulfide reductase [Methylomonas sp. LL1]
MKTKLIIVLAAIVAMSAGVWLQLKARTAGPVEQTNAQLEFSFPDVDGRMQNVRQWRGKILLINFWATWCGPCLKEIPEFIQWQREYQASNLQFVGIAIDDQAAVADYLRGININYPILIAGDAGGMLARQLGNIINAVPFTVLVNQRGQIVYRQPGELSRDQFLKVVRPLLGTTG